MPDLNLATRSAAALLTARILTMISRLPLPMASALLAAAAMITACPTVEDGPECGNGVFEDGETCDGDELGGRSCETEGHSYGTLSCNDECELDATECVDDPCWNYPCEPYGTASGQTIGDLSYVASNGAARELAGDDGILNFHELFQSNEAHGGSLRGAMIFITAGWCVYCPIEARQLENLYQQLKDQGILLIGLVTEDNSGRNATPEFAENYATQYGWTFPTIAGQLPLEYWVSDDSAGATPAHLFFDIRNMKIYGRASGLMETKMLGYALEDLAAGPSWGDNGMRSISFDCTPGVGTEQEPNGLSATPEDASSMPFELDGTICPPAIEEGLLLDEDIFDLGTLSAGQVVGVTMSPINDSPVYPFFQLLRLNSTGSQLEWQQYGPSDLSATPATRQWVIDASGHYLLAAFDGRLMSGAHYGDSLPPVAHSCCEGGPDYRYDMAIQSVQLDSASETALTVGEAHSARMHPSDLAVYPVTVVSGQSYTFTLTASSISTLDPYLILMNASDGAVIDANDDEDWENQNYNSKITWTSTLDGEVWLVASYFQAIFRTSNPAYTIKAQ